MDDLLNSAFLFDLRVLEGSSGGVSLSPSVSPQFFCDRLVTRLALLVYLRGGRSMLTLRRHPRGTHPWKTRATVFLPKGLPTGDRSPAES